MVLRSLGLDPRSLAAFRVGLGVLLLWDLATRWPELEAHYSDAGILPRPLLLEWSSWVTPSLHLASGSVVWQGFLFLLAAGAAIALLLGWHTRVAAVCSWLLLASLHARNPSILHGGDALLRVLSFWAIFVPLERAASLDRRQGRSREDPSRSVLSIGGLALSLQICFLYWFSALLKWHPAWLEDGSAIGLALRLDQLSTAWGRRLLEMPELLEAASKATIALELVGPFLVWIPWATGRFRGLAVGLFVGFHLLGLAPALHLDLFPWVCAVAWTVFLPAGFWESWAPRRLVGSRVGPGFPAPRWSPTGRRRRRAGVVVAQAVAGVALVGVFAWNLRTLDPDRQVRWLPASLAAAVEVVGLHQNWNLFAPFPSGDDGWFVMPGRLEDGTEIDVWTGAAPTEEKPGSIAAAFGSPRWRKFLMNLPARSHRRLRRGFGRWLCRDWNRPGERPYLEEVRIVYLSEPTSLEGVEGPVRPIPLWRQACPDPSPPEPHTGTGR